MKYVLMVLFAPFVVVGALVGSIWFALDAGFSGVQDSIARKLSE